MVESAADMLEALQAENRALKQRFECLSEELRQTRHQAECNGVEKFRLDAMLSHVLGHLGYGAFAVDLQGHLCWMTPPVADWFGCDPEQVVGQPCREVLSDCATHLDPFLRTGQDVHGLEISLKNARGRTVPTRMSVAPITGGDGRIQGIVVAIEDMSRLRDLSEQASRVSTLTALGEMSATIAHEIRNPLGGIGGFAGLLERDMRLDDPNRRLVKKIIEGVAGLNRMVTSLLNYTRPPHLNMRPVDAVEMLEDCLGFFEIDAGARIDEIEIERRFPEAPLICRADPEHIQQIVLNLLHNAVQAMPAGGRMTVALSEIDTRDDARTYLNRTCVALAVSDTGMGLTDEVKAKLFMPFFTTKENGNGLGLATAKKVIEAHGGDIAVESGPDKGATFTLYIPK